MMASPWQASSGSVCHWVGSHHVEWHEEVRSVTRMASLTPSSVVTSAWFRKCGHTATVCPGRAPVWGSGVAVWLGTAAVPKGDDVTFS